MLVVLSLKNCIISYQKQFFLVLCTCDFEDFFKVLDLFSELLLKKLKIKEEKPACNNILKIITNIKLNLLFLIIIINEHLSDYQKNLFSEREIDIIYSKILDS